MDGPSELTDAIKATADAYLNGAPKRADKREGTYDPDGDWLGGGILLVRLRVDPHAHEEEGGRPDGQTIGDFFRRRRFPFGRGDQ